MSNLVDTSFDIVKLEEEIHCCIDAFECDHYPVEVTKIEINRTELIDDDKTHIYGVSVVVKIPALKNEGSIHERSE